MLKRWLLGSFGTTCLFVLLFTPAFASAPLAKGADGKLEFTTLKNVDLTDILGGASRSADTETIYGKLYLPSKIGSPVPAVIIMHASGGVFDWREIKMAKLLKDAGIAAFVVYSFQARGIKDASSTQGTKTTFGMRVADAFGALKLLSTHPDIDSNRIGVMGYSSGGFGSLLSVEEKVRSALTNDNTAFAAHVNVYASPMLIFQNPHPTKAPTLFLMGELDDLCPKERVLGYAQRLRQAGGDVETIVYPDAHHVFDASMKEKTFKGDNDGACQFQVLDNGLLVDSATGEHFPERGIYADDGRHIKPCLTNTMTFGGNRSARKQYTKDVVDFFVKKLRR